MVKSVILRRTIFHNIQVRFLLTEMNRSIFAYFHLRRARFLKNDFYFLPFDLEPSTHCLAVTARWVRRAFKCSQVPTWVVLSVTVWHIQLGYYLFLKTFRCRWGRFVSTVVTYLRNKVLLPSTKWSGWLSVDFQRPRRFEALEKS